ncbi:hypothetical protein [Fodinicurvata sp. EGI_FJ10296]|uniref:hypothetical protein n=1 Tax=Fodinicurvata sp. EGI_FJ10296 TaxID=3231908 RepID=UPI003455C458
MKKLMAAVLVLALVGAVGVGGWAFMKHGDALAAMLPETEAAAPDPIFVEFEPIRIPVIANGQVTRLVTLQIMLQVDSNEVGDSLIDQAPRLNDAFLADMYGDLHEGRGVRNGVVNLDHVKRRLMAVSASVMGENAVRDVLVQMIAERPLRNV